MNMLPCKLFKGQFATNRFFLNLPPRSDCQGLFLVLFLGSLVAQVVALVVAVRRWVLLLLLLSSRRIFIILAIVVAITVDLVVADPVNVAVITDVVIDVLVFLSCYSWWPSRFTASAPAAAALLHECL